MCEIKNATKLGLWAEVRLEDAMVLLTANWRGSSPRCGQVVLLPCAAHTPERGLHRQSSTAGDHTPPTAILRLAVHSLLLRAAAGHSEPAHLPDAQRQA